MRLQRKLCDKLQKALRQLRPQKMIHPTTLQRLLTTAFFLSLEPIGQ